GQLALARERQRLAQAELEREPQGVTGLAGLGERATELEQAHARAEVVGRRLGRSAVERLVTGQRIELGEVVTLERIELGQRSIGPLGGRAWALVDECDQAVTEIDVVDELEHDVGQL